MPKKGLTPGMFKPKTSTGINKKRVNEKGRAGGKRVTFPKENPTKLLQFLGDPDTWTEFETHSFQEDGRWQYVPALGENDPLSQSEDRDVSKTSYRFAALVYNHTDKAMQILENGKTLAALLYHKYERNPKAFAKRVWEVTIFNTTPQTYDVSVDEDTRAVSLANKTPEDIDEYLMSQLKNYYGDNLPDTSALEDDDDEEFDEEDESEDEESEDDEELELDDDDELESDGEEDEDSDDEEDDDDFEFDDDDEAPPTRMPAKKAAARKAPAAKKAARRPRAA